MKLDSKNLILFKISSLDPPAVCCDNIRFGQFHKGSELFIGSFFVTSKIAPFIILSFNSVINSSFKSGK